MRTGMHWIGEIRKEFRPELDGCYGIYTIGVFGVDIGSMDAPSVIAAGSTEKYGRAAVPSAVDRSASWTTTAG